MASITSASLLSEAEFGCEHLAAILTQSGNTAEQFKSSFLKTHNALAPRPLPLFPKPLTVDDLPKQKGGLRTASLLRPKYTCLTCSEVCAPADRPAHTKETGHQFYMESRGRILFCQGCGDFVYDHDLERLRSLPYGMHQAASRRRRSSESSSDEQFVRNNANKRACAKQGVRGLYNLGQTCYLNVILQTLLHDPILNAYFLGNGHQSHDCTLQDCIGCAVAEAFADFNSSDKAEGFAALNLLLASWRASPTLAGYHQQDAHEYYQFLVDKLHTSTEGHVDDHDQGCSCFFHQTFYGKLKSSVMCDNCGNITKTEDPMLDLSLDVQVQAKKRAMGGGVGPSATPTLNGCLESFTSPERLMAGVYNCSECGGTPQKATKRLRIKKLPAILCMQLKRFEHSSAVSEKVEGRVDFPLSINMLPYTTHRHREDLDKSKFVYDLSSAVVHKGKLDAGHYYVYCKQGDQWVLFNDDQVTAATEAEVLNADAYLLFYNLRLFTAPLQ
ncbi:ubiquitin C-terminal hydrolase Ubp8, putative [Aspergillus fumigatus A1163]|uniref:Ubiquitin C-terminal hydrolase Ubp8, putative n=2 Tax=Aspergillus fumigatus TaxID=746128 RepID=Q4WLQ3_ASPFU|nr:ubiquitin C-terminal hydrolase Ubp8, putative [Aspergillus fumigatus Af293]EAL89111.2 ubiquitin C-terminal hydrolase Ubp8, putative [Aspergillus fumigatus Af293]EDP49838.1 ubiquitin C-terminal hydrolase Ubp8, putative [Aspergillus fumigatus A1163]KEY77618.1 ubiquitin hydrolase Ubp8 [Aspergillus fumigatus]